MIRWSNSHPVRSQDDLRSYERVRAAEQQSYVQLEECRLRVEQLQASEQASPTLDEIHRQIGLAGYHASTAMDGAERRECLRRARQQADEIPAGGTGAGARAAIHAIELRVGGALKALSEALAIAPSDEHLHLARERAASAQLSLKRPLVEQRIVDAHRTS